jgi:exoribonuclease II
MNILFEDDGQIKAASIMSESDASAQIELPGGRRIKIKAVNILMRFAAPSAAELHAAASAECEKIDMSLLWESAPQGSESGFADLAREYFGADPKPAQVGATLMALQRSPMYFYKRGKGVYKAAPEEAMKAALASIERKAREAEQMSAWINELVAGSAPEEIKRDWVKLLHAPDRNSLTYKALAAAADKARVAPVHLLAKSGAITSTHTLHFSKFLLATFPKGTTFADGLTASAASELPLTTVQAFSIDDDSTTEIDDAFSVTKTASGYRVGIHIAAPTLGIAMGSPLDQVARDRLSTVYMPGNKITMLPEQVSELYSLNEGKTVAAVSLYLDVDLHFAVTGSTSAIDAVPIAKNLRIPMLDRGDWLNESDTSAPFAHELRVLNAVTSLLQAKRGEQVNNRVDYNFTITGNADSADARVEIKPRARGSAVDTIVSELMIFANVAWAEMLGAAQRAGMFRVQGAGKTRMSSLPGPHEGLNVPSYLWATSPLRRYADLLNQRQIVALLRGESAPYPKNSAELLAAIADFDTTYSSYADFQQQMEFYWCVRFIEQERTEKLVATTIRENLVRLDQLPLVQRINDMPHQEPGTQVILAVTATDLFEPAVHLRFVEKVPVA